MSFLKNVFNSQPKIEKLIAELNYVSPQMTALREARSKLGDELALAYAKYHDFPMDLMVQDTAMGQTALKLEESDGKVRIKAAQDLAALKVPEALPALIATLETNYPQVRVGAAIALGKLGLPGAAAALEKVISTAGEPEELVNAAKDSLARINVSQRG